MKLLKIFGIIIGSLILIAALAGIYWFTAKPWIPKIEIVNPGTGGVRINQDGIFANYYQVTTAGKHPALLLIGGSEGGISEGIDNFAREMHKEGYNVLNVSFYRAPKQTKQLIEVPVEIFDKSIEFLKSQPNIDKDKIGVIGASKGGEATLIVASRHPELKIAIAGMPSNVIWAGIDWEHLFGAAEPKSSWSLGANPLPFMPYGQYDNKTGAYSLYKNGLKEISKYENTIIPIEKSKARILLICGEQDALWPSCEMARQVYARAKAKNGPEIDILSYPNAGHGVFGMPVNRSEKSKSKLASLGGTYEGNADAREDALPRIKAYLKAAFQ